MKQILATAVILTFAVSPAERAMKDYDDVRDAVAFGVRSVGNGGGYAEMQAKFIHLRLNDWIADAPPAPHLEISPQCDSDPIVVSTPSHVTLASCALYSLNGPSRDMRPKEFREIAAWVLSARLMANGFNFNDAFNHATRTFADFSHSEESLEISLLEGNFLFHDLTIQTRARTNKILSIEGKTKTEDFTSIVLDRMTCPEPESRVNSWGISNSSSRSLSAQQGLIEADATWICESGEHWGGVLQITLATFQQEVDPHSTSVQIMRKHRLR